jgi:hypothetical protein
MPDTVISWVTSAQQVAERAWGWLEMTQQRFALPDVAVDQLDASEHLKPLGELALAGSIAIREGATGSRTARTAPALVEFAWQQLRAGDLLYELQRDNPVDTMPMELYAPFVRAGYRHQRLDTLLAHLTGLRAARVPEVVPDRMLGILNTERLLGLPPRGELVELTSRTWLGGQPEPWTPSLLSLYAMTHTVFHLTDWGARPRGLPEHLQAYLHAWLPAWLEVYVEAGHWDVVAEMLIVDLCLTEPDHPVATWDPLARAQQPDGLLPAVPGRVPRDTARAFRNHYHSTVVGAIAGTLAVSRRLDARGAR